jgi:hypothetical protein
MMGGVEARYNYRLRVNEGPARSLVEDRDPNAARNLNPNRRDKPGAGVDGHKTPVPAGTEAA